MKVFISYRHQQQDWVKENLVPCLEAGGTEILVDYRTFSAGKRVIGQMDDLQDQADKTLLLFTPAYLESAYCLHEMNRALNQDPNFSGTVLPVVLEDCQPDCLAQDDPPLWVDLTNPKMPDPWALLMNDCQADLGISAPKWLKAHKDIRRYLGRNESINLVVNERPIKWRELLKHLKTEAEFKDLTEVDLESGATMSRQGFIGAMLGVSTNAVPTSDNGNDLVFLDQQIKNRNRKTRVIFKHFDRVKNRHFHDNDLFSTLRYLITETRQLTRALPFPHPLFRNFTG